MGTRIGTRSSLGSGQAGGSAGLHGHGTARRVCTVLLQLLRAVLDADVRMIGTNSWTTTSAEFRDAAGKLQSSYAG
jgi:hypothetical protein